MILIEIKKERKKERTNLSLFFQVSAERKI